MKAEPVATQSSYKDKGTAISKEFIFEHLENTSLYDEEHQMASLRNLDIQKSSDPVAHQEYEIKEGINLSISGPSSLTESNRIHKESNLEGSDVIKLCFSSA